MHKYSFVYEANFAHGLMKAAKNSSAVKTAAAGAVVGGVVNKARGGSFTSGAAGGALVGGAGHMALKSKAGQKMLYNAGGGAVGAAASRNAARLKRAQDRTTIMKNKLDTNAKIAKERDAQAKMRAAATSAATSAPANANPIANQ